MIREQQISLRLVIVLGFLKQARIITVSFFVSFERTVVIQINNIIFYCNRFSAANSKSMRRFRIQLLLSDNTWSSQYKIPKEDRYSNVSTDWTLVSLNCTVKIYGNNLVYDEIDRPLADLRFSKISISHVVL